MKIMRELPLYEILYVLVLIPVCMRIIYDTRSTTKTLAYLLLVIFLPVAGIIIYFSFGINYRKRKIYSKKLIENEAVARELNDRILEHSRRTFEHGDDAVKSNKELAYMLAKNAHSLLASGNHVKLLINGEEKFPEVLETIRRASHHIHVEYYIFEDDGIGQELEKLLIQKAQEGVEVRFIYDDFGSRHIRKSLVPRLLAGGVKAYPFQKIKLIVLANRLNYRNHRKIIVIDGWTAFVGGINVSDRYINAPGISNHWFWRDTHLRIDGPGAYYLQYVFMCDWNFCAQDHLQPSKQYFPIHHRFPGDKVVQIAASGPDSDVPVILFSLLQAISRAKEEVLITTPYFIPGESMLDAIMVAASGGVSVKLLVPGISDSDFVNTASRSYYADVMNAGGEVYLYQKGFVHAKTLVVDQKVIIVGTSNMDYRSFELNFEVSAIVYDEAIAGQLRNIFYADLEHSEKLDRKAWRARPARKKFAERLARLMSPLL